MKDKGIAVIIGIVIVFGGLYAIGSRNKDKTDNSADIANTSTTSITTTAPAETTTENTTTTSAETTTTTKNTTTNDSKYDYVLNTSTMKFHSPSCLSVGDIQPQNRKDVHTTSDDLKAQGYEPCGRCNPR